jgi:hypothetical protein
MNENDICLVLFAERGSDLGEKSFSDEFIGKIYQLKE